MVATGQPGFAQTRSACRFDRCHRRSATRRRVCHHCRYATAVRALCRHDSGDRRRAIRLVLASGIWTYYRSIGCALFYAQPVRPAGQRRLCRTRFDLDLNGWSLPTGFGNASSWHPGGFHLAHRRRWFYHRCRHIDFCEPNTRLSWLG